MLRAVVVDDSASLRLLTRMTLEIDGHAQVIGEAVDGLEAIDLIESLIPHVAIIDIHLPGISGVQVIEYLRRKLSSTRLIAYSSDDRALADALYAGADAAVLKTGDAAGLISALTPVPAEPMLS